MSEEKRLPFVGYGVHGGYLYLPQLMSELFTRFYFRVNCFRLKHFFKWVTVTEIPEPYSFHGKKKKSWISNNETVTERKVDPEVQTLTRECALQDLYTIWLLTMSFKCYLYYDIITKSGLPSQHFRTALFRLFSFVGWFVFHVISRSRIEFSKP